MRSAVTPDWLHVKKSEHSVIHCDKREAMSDELRVQRKCYYASSEYFNSFWGKYIYIYEGNGSLRDPKRESPTSGARFVLDHLAATVSSAGGRFPA